MIICPPTRRQKRLRKQNNSQYKFLHALKLTLLAKILQPISKCHTKSGLNTKMVKEFGGILKELGML